MTRGTLSKVTVSSTLENLDEKDVKAFLIRNNEKGRRNYAKKRKPPVGYNSADASISNSHESLAGIDFDRKSANEEIRKEYVDMRLPDSQPTGHEMLPTQSNTEEPECAPL